MTRSAVRSPRLLLLPALVGVLAGSVLDDGERYSVYLRVADLEDQPIAPVVERLEMAFTDAGFQLLARTEAGSDAERCVSEALTLVVYDPELVRPLLAHGSHAAFAVPMRVSVFRDELGVHVSVVDPRSLHRTMVAEEGYDEAWAELSRRLVSVAASAANGADEVTPYGQWRDKGRIGKTFGIMTGGPFPEKIETVLELPREAGTPMELARKLQEGMELQGDWEWQIRGIYAVELTPDYALVGVTGSHMEARAFDIVGNGNQNDREDLACAGVDHAPAFPQNLLLERTAEGTTRITLVDEMFRMKMYFEDAGKMAFAKNMGMPGSIEDEIRRKVELILGS